MIIKPKRLAWVVVLAIIVALGIVIFMAKPISAPTLPNDGQDLKLGFYEPTSVPEDLWPDQPLP